MAVKCKQLIYNPINALTFRITGGTKVVVPHSIGKTIQSLEASNKTIFELDEVVTVQHLKYKINYINKKYNKGVLYYDLSMAKKTKSSTFIMPMLGGTRRLFFWTRLFLNCFIKTEKEGYCISLLYRQSEDPLFLKFENAVSQFKDFKRVYSPTENTIMFIFDIPKKFKRNFKHFLNGAYSKFSALYKVDLMRFHDQSVDSELGQILYKDPSRREKMEDRLGVILEDDTELLSIVNIENEIFKIEQYV